MHIALKVYDDRASEEELAKIVERCKDEEHIFVERWGIAQMRIALLSDHLRNNCDVTPHHPFYWPSWFERGLTSCFHRAGLDIVYP